VRGGAGRVCECDSDCSWDWDAHCDCDCDCREGVSWSWVCDCDRDWAHSEELMLQGPRGTGGSPPGARAAGGAAAGGIASSTAASTVAMLAVLLPLGRSRAAAAGGKRGSGPCARALGPGSLQSVTCEDNSQGDTGVLMCGGNKKGASTEGRWACEHNEQDSYRLYRTPATHVTASRELSSLTCAGWGQATEHSPAPALTPAPQRRLCGAPLSLRTHMGGREQSQALPVG